MMARLPLTNSWPARAVPTRRLLLAAGAAAALPAWAQTAPYPSRPITLVVPFAAGGGTDTVARMIGLRLGALLGQSVVIENRPGANGLIASRQVARAQADGYTLMLGSNSTHVIAPLTARAAADGIQATEADFAILSVLANAPLVLCVRAAAAEQNLAAFVLRARRSRTTYATFGVGSSAHLMGEVLADSARTELVHVAYKGSSPALNDLVAGHVDSAFLTVAAIKGAVDGGTVRPLAVTGRVRVASLPQVPTFEELGVADMANAGWFAVFAPSRTPAALATRLSDALRRIAGEPEVGAKLVELGLEPVGSTMAQARSTWSRSVSLAAPIVKRANIELQ
jgi:tripartite-type tricarboxylate transporter receptor subunit TctC